MRPSKHLIHDARGGSQYILYLGLVALISFVVLPSAFHLEDTMDSAYETSTARFDTPGKYVGGDIFHNNEGQPALVDQSGAGGDSDPTSHLSGENACADGAACADCGGTKAVCCPPGQDECCSDGAGGTKKPPGYLTGHYGKNVCSSCEGSWEVKQGVPVGPVTLEGAGGQIAGHAFACLQGSVGIPLTKLLKKLKKAKPNTSKPDDDSGGFSPGWSPYSRCPTFPTAEELQAGCLKDKFGDQNKAYLCWGEVKVEVGGCVGPKCVGTGFGGQSGWLTILDSSQGGGSESYDINDPCGPPISKEEGPSGCKNFSSGTKPGCEEEYPILKKCANGDYNGGTPVRGDENIRQCAEKVRPDLFEDPADLSDCMSRSAGDDQTGCAYYAECRAKVDAVTPEELAQFCVKQRGADNGICKLLTEPVRGSGRNRRARQLAKKRAHNDVLQEYVADCVGFSDDLHRPGTGFGTTGGPGGKPSIIPEVSAGVTCCLIN